MLEGLFGNATAINIKELKNELPDSLIEGDTVVEASRSSGTLLSSPTSACC
jgi:hypothetical protein